MNHSWTLRLPCLHTRHMRTDLVACHPGLFLINSCEPFLCSMSDTGETALCLLQRSREHINMTFLEIQKKYWVSFHLQKSVFHPNDNVKPSHDIHLLKTEALEASLMCSYLKQLLEQCLFNYSKLCDILDVCGMVPIQSHATFWE